jgi:hypothetical protein
MMQGCPMSNPTVLAALVAVVLGWLLFKKFKK